MYFIYYKRCQHSEKGYFKALTQYMSTIKVQFVRLVNKPRFDTSFCLPGFKLSSRAISCHANSFEVNQRLTAQNWMAPDKLYQPLIRHFC